MKILKTILDIEKNDVVLNADCSGYILDETLYSWTVKFRKVVRQQIWGEVVVYCQPPRQFTSKCNNERIIKIGLHLPKLS